MPLEYRNHNTGGGGHCRSSEEAIDVEIYPGTREDIRDHNVPRAIDWWWLDRGERKLTQPLHLNYV